MAFNLFGKARAAPASSSRATSNPSDPAGTIIKIRGTLETLDKRDGHLLKKINAQTTEAREKMRIKVRCHAHTWVEAKESGASTAIPRPKPHQP